MAYSRVNNRVWQAVVSNSVFHALPDSVIIRHPPTNTHLLFSHLSCLIREDHIRGYLFIRTINHDLREALTEHLKKNRDALKQVFTIQLDTTFQSWLNWGLVWLLTRWNTGYCWFSSRCLRVCSLFICVPSLKCASLCVLAALPRPARPEIRVLIGTVEWFQWRAVAAL